MRRDLIIGILASILFHVGFLFGSKIFESSGKKTVVVEEEIPSLQLMAMPEIEPEEPEPSTEVSDAPVENTRVDFAPPSQTDVPQTITMDSFVQKIQPPPPEGVKTSASAMVIPQTRPTQVAAKMGNVFNLKDLDQRPIVRVQIAPNYPYEMHRQGINGEVVIAFICDTNGEVRDPYVTRSSHREFEANALMAIQKWKFRPGKKGGKAVNTRMSVPLIFNLKDND